MLDAATETDAVPLVVPLVAVTVKGPPAVAPAVKSPFASMAPPPDTVQVKAGAGEMAVPNWSFAVAVNGCVPLVATLAVGGATVTVVSVATTVTATDEVTNRPAVS